MEFTFNQLIAVLKSFSEHKLNCDEITLITDLKGIVHGRECAQYINSEESLRFSEISATYFLSSPQKLLHEECFESLAGSPIVRHERRYGAHRFRSFVTQGLKLMGNPQCYVHPEDRSFQENIACLEALEDFDKDRIFSLETHSDVGYPDNSLLAYSIRVQTADYLAENFPQETLEYLLKVSEDKPVTTSAERNVIFAKPNVSMRGNDLPEKDHYFLKNSGRVYRALLFNRVLQQKNPQDLIWRVPGSYLPALEYTYGEWRCWIETTDELTDEEMLTFKTLLASENIPDTGSMTPEALKRVYKSVIALRN